MAVVSSWGSASSSLSVSSALITANRSTGSSGSDEASRGESPASSPRAPPGDSGFRCDCDCASSPSAVVGCTRAGPDASIAPPLTSPAVFDAMGADIDDAAPSPGLGRAECGTESPLGNPHEPKKWQGHGTLPESRARCPPRSPLNRSGAPERLPVASSKRFRRRARSNAAFVAPARLALTPSRVAPSLSLKWSPRFWPKSYLLL